MAKTVWKHSKLFWHDVSVTAKHSDLMNSWPILPRLLDLSRPYFPDGWTIGQVASVSWECSESSSSTKRPFWTKWRDLYEGDYGLYHGLDTGCLNWHFSWNRSAPTGKYKKRNSSTLRELPSSTFDFIFHQPSVHQALYFYIISGSLLD
jgi:hypothetical protein